MTGPYHRRTYSRFLNVSFGKILWVCTLLGLYFIKLVNSSSIFRSNQVTANIKPDIMGMTPGLDNTFNTLILRTIDLQKAFVDIYSPLIWKSSIILNLQPQYKSLAFANIDCTADWDIFVFNYSNSSQLIAIFFPRLVDWGIGSKLTELKSDLLFI